jgi:putative CocE/NonD family hydrolase
MNRRILLSTLTLVVLFSGFTIGLSQPMPQPTPVAIKIEPATFDPYVGEYEDRRDLGGTVFSFFREADKYYLRITNQDKIEITPSGPASFFNVPHRSHIVFHRGVNGTVTGATFTQGVAYEIARTGDTPQPDTRIAYTRNEVMIPMRDGVKLHTLIFAPEGQTDKLPIYVERTPYGIDYWASDGINQYRPELAHERYIFVFQDIRGRYKSDGTFVMMRPPRDKTDLKSVDESTDTYDTIDWLIKNVANNNGRVGIAGVSYPGWLAAVSLIDHHPALKAVSPQAPVTDVWLGDDLFHNGAFRETYAYDWAYTLDAFKGDGDVTYDPSDTAKWFMPLGKLQSLAAEASQRSATWQGFIDHPSWDSYWQARATETYLKHTEIPTLVVGGWWDQEDMFGPLTLYKTLQKTDSENKVFLVMGPWNHGGWGGRARRLGPLDFGSDTGNWFRQNIQAPFFAHYLKDKGNYVPPEVTSFRSGVNQWETYDIWSPRNNKVHELYLQAGGKLGFNKPIDKGDSSDNYVSDPANPVMYRKPPLTATYGDGSTWYTWRTDDQRLVTDRNDVLSWQTDPLAADLTFTGDLFAKLFASTSGSDSDWVVKLIDVYGPNEPSMAGYELMVGEEIFRGRNRQSFERPEPITPNKPLDYTIDMRGTDHTFKKGHRIMVQVQSTWFPLYDRNPQTFVPNIFKATAADYKAATQRIYRSAEYPSHLEVREPAQ